MQVFAFQKKISHSIRVYLKTECEKTNPKKSMFWKSKSQEIGYAIVPEIIPGYGRLDSKRELRFNSYATPFPIEVFDFDSHHEYFDA